MELSSSISAVLHQLDTAIAHHPDRYVTPPPNESERRVASVVRKYLKQHRPEARVTLNEMLHGFEADVVVRLPAASARSSERVLNIEVDGPKHGMTRKKHFTRRRDEYLTQRRGCVVVRVDVCRLQETGGRQDVEGAVREALGLFVGAPGAKH